MLTSTFKNETLSLLGFGTMRFPVIDGKNADIDVPAAMEMLDYAKANGITYYDTAWGYHDGNSEKVLGEWLKSNKDETINVATKFPGYDLNNMKKAPEIFEAQLARLNVDCIDYYLLHNVNELNVDAYIDPENGILEYFRTQKAAGRIRHLGFSAHGSVDVMRKFLAVYKQDMEFCQIQLNYVDWKFQGAWEKLNLLRFSGIPVWVMEPLRGGKLATLGKEQLAVLQTQRPELDAIDWAFGFLQAVGVKMILSGMSTLEQVKDNIRRFEAPVELEDDDLVVLQEMADNMVEAGTVPCTGCSYCTAYCPQNLPIPKLMSLYNENKFSGGSFLTFVGLSALKPEEKPSNCAECHSCEQVCPQHVNISFIMSKLAELPNGK